VFAHIILRCDIQLQRSMKHSIVFIDDDEDDLVILEESVASTFSNIECLRFSSPVTAIKYLSSPEVSPLCIFLDINMPIMRGDEVLRKIRAYDHLNKTMIVILSTCITEDAKRMLLADGADSAIVKPSRFGEFRDRVCDAIWCRLNKMHDT
jgi:DNA-binding response OmpR family regulator